MTSSRKQRLLAKHYDWR